MSRRRILRVTLLWVTVVTSAWSSFGCSPDSQPTEAQEVPFVERSFTYKTIGDAQIEADVYRADDQIARPVVVWIHGGALMFGSRRNPPVRLLDLCRVAGCVLVSIDYRLAPDVQLPAIIEDLEDAFSWIRERGPELFQADPDRLVVAGGSAGGYLTMVSGFRIQPRPDALVSYWGYGALDTFDAEPSEYYRSVAPLLSAEEAYGEGGNLYLYLRQNGLWTQVVTGFDPETQRHELEPYAPVHNVTAEYPPVLLVHGTNDNDVPHSESVDMAEQLSRSAVSHELILVPDGGHGLGGADTDLITDAHNRALAFIHRHLLGAERADEIEPLLAAMAALDAAVALSRQGSIEEAIDAYARVDLLEPRLTIHASAWYSLCWNGTLWGFAGDVLTACERALEQAPGPGWAAWIRHGRGIARALTGDTEGAIEDLQAYLAAEVGSADQGFRVEDWIGALRASEDPFTPEVLQSLRDD